MYSHSANGKATPENGFATCSVNLQIDVVTCEVKTMVLSSEANQGFRETNLEVYSRTLKQLAK